MKYVTYLRQQARNSKLNDLIPGRADKGGASTGSFVLVRLLSEAYFLAA
jgi:hypothetical protein